MRFSFGNDNSTEKALKQAEKYAQQGKYSAAVDEYQKVLDANPNDVTLLNTIGDVCVRANRNDEAIRHFLKVAERYETEGAVASAIAVYKKVLKLDPSNVDRGVRVADLMCRQGSIPDARRQYQAAVESYKQKGEKHKAFRTMQKIADLDPENFGLRLELGEEYRQAGFVKEAYQAFVQAGQELQRHSRVDEALEAFRRALDLRPDSKIALNALADGYAQQGKVVEALRMIDGLLEETPGDPDLLSILGRTYVNARMLDEAEATFARLMEVDKTRTDGLMEVARQHVEAGAYDRGIAIVDRCVDQLLARGQKKRATALLKEVLKRDRSNVAALERLADIYTRVDERRNLAATLDTLVEVATRVGRKDVATDALQKLMDIEPELARRQHAAPARAAAAGTDREDMPEGFEAAMDLTAWTKEVVTPDSGQPARRAEARRSLPEGFESASATMEITRGFGDEPVLEISERGGGANDYDVPGGESAPSGNYLDYSMELADDLVKEHPEFLQAKIKLLEELVVGQPKYVAGHQKLKKLYVEAGMNDKAAAQCLEIARLHEEAGETEQAKACVAEAYELKPSVEQFTAQAGGGAQADETVDLDEMFTLAEFNKYFDREWRRAIRDAKPLSLLKLEVDVFNDYVDTYGLLSGDYCLERVAGALEGDLMRPGDLISALGGGAFFVLLPDTPDHAVGIVGERLRKKVADLRIVHEGSTVADWITVSVGAATAIPHPKYSSDTLITAADGALVQAKVAGGNQVATAPLLTN
jgi:diguanylate cyclase (GGDEF)-like protein